MSKLLNFIDLKQGEEDKEKVLEMVTANVSFRGSNLWILACAIIIASVGLNVNSTAVIIGAMLISPLMGPIVGAGFSLGIFDFNLLWRSLKNLLIATIVSLSVASIYFLLSPFKETQSELLARTSPNIYDVLIAFFGGIVGVVAITRVEKGNPIPGVAIATALMPPLCTAGYGLSIGNFSFFFGALYLYTINCVFICISTFLIVKYLHYPPATLLNPKHEKRIKYGITALIIVLMAPSIYFAFNLWLEKHYSQKINEFIGEEFLKKGYTLIYKHTNFTNSPKSLELAFLSKKFSNQEIESLNAKLEEYEISNTKLVIKQDTTDIKKLIKNEFYGQNAYIDQKDLKIAELEKAIKANAYENSSILREAQILFPQIQKLSISNHFFYENTDSSQTLPVMLCWSKGEFSDTSQAVLQAWLKEKLQKDKILLLMQKQ